MAGQITVSKEDFGNLLSEGFHVAFRKGVDSTKAHDVWTAITNLDPGEWDKAIEYVMHGLEYSEVVKFEKEDA